MPVLLTLFFNDLQYKATLKREKYTFLSASFSLLAMAATTKHIAYHFQKNLISRPYNS